MKKCPHCEKNVSETARKCKFCWKRIVEKTEEIKKIENKENSDETELIYFVGIWKMLIWWDDDWEDNWKDEDTNTYKILEICLIGIIILWVLLVVLAFIVW